MEKLLLLWLFKYWVIFANDGIDSFYMIDELAVDMALTVFTAELLLIEWDYYDQKRMRCDEQWRAWTNADAHAGSFPLRRCLRVSAVARILQFAGWDRRLAPQRPLNQVCCQELLSAHNRGKQITSSQHAQPSHAHLEITGVSFHQATLEMNCAFDCDGALALEERGYWSQVKVCVPGCRIESESQIRSPGLLTCGS